MQVVISVLEYVVLLYIPSSVFSFFKKIFTIPPIIQFK